MFHGRRLGVKEANAIEDIVVYEWKEKRGLFITTPEKEAYKAAWEVVERRQPVGLLVKREKQRVVPPEPEYGHEDDKPVVFNHMVGVIIIPSQPVGDPLRFMTIAILGFMVWLAAASIYHVFS